MADDLQGIVQRMIDAGEPEENIASVIRAQQPFDINASRAALSAANTQPLPATPTLASEFTPSKIGERALAGAKGEAKGFATGMVAPAVMLGYGLRHPVEAASKAGQAALMLGAAGVNAVAHPVDTYNAVAPAIMRLAANPESIGEAAGGIGAALATPPLVKLAKGTALGKAVAAGASDAVNRIPGVKVAREVLAAEQAARTPGVSAPGTRMAAMAREPVGVGATLTPDEAALIGNRGAGHMQLAERKQLLDQMLQTAAKRPSTVEAAAQEFGGINPNVPNKRVVSNIESVSTSGGPNASGESGASREALSRLSSMRAKGEMFGVLKGGKLRPLIGPEAVDYTPQPGEQYGIIDSTGGFRTLSGGR